MSYEQLLDEPKEKIEFALLIWAMHAKRDKLETERQEWQNANNTSGTS